MKTSQSCLAVTLIAILTLALAGAATPAGADMTVSGTVTAIDAANGTITVTEIGPGIKSTGENLIARRTFTLNSRTELARVARADGAAPTGWLGDYVEAPATVDQLRPGDFVTVEVERDGMRLIARRVTVMDLSKT